MCGPRPEGHRPEGHDHSPGWVEGSAERIISRPALLGLTSWVRGGQYLEAAAAAAAAGAPAEVTRISHLLLLLLLLLLVLPPESPASATVQGSSGTGSRGTPLSQRELDQGVQEPGASYLAGEVSQLSSVGSGDVGTLS